MAVIIGTDAGETLRGTVGDDTIRARGGDDTVFGLPGDDLLYGERGDDILIGGSGDDRLDGGAGSDTADYRGSTGIRASLLDGLAVDGRGGHDLLVGIENLTGGAFADTLTGDARANRLLGGAGDDLLKGGLGNDLLDGGGPFADDTASWFDDGGVGAVTVNLITGVATRGTERDTLVEIEHATGTRWGDTLVGNPLGNILRGAAGDDVLLGQAGDDRFHPGPGDDIVQGGEGYDRVDYSTIAAPGAEGYGVRTDADDPFLFHSVEGDDRLEGVEEIIGTRFRDEIGLLSRPDIGRSAFGGGGDDVLVGGRLDQTLDGGDGNDRINGGSGFDLLLGGRGDDDLQGDEPTEPEACRNAGSDELRGGAGDDSLAGWWGFDRLFGGNGADTLQGGPDDDRLTGGAGNDLFAHEGRNAVTSDELCFYFTESGRDVVTDFVKGQDRLRFTVDLTPLPLRVGQASEGMLNGFRDLDSNHDGVLDDGDRYVSIERVTEGDTTRLSTVIDVGDFSGVTEVLVVFGVTGLGAADFVT